MTGWVCQWKPFWIPTGGSFQKAYLEDWVYINPDSSANRVMREDCTSKRKRSEETLSTPSRILPLRTVVDLWPGQPPRGNVEAPLPPPTPRCKFIHPRQLSPSPECLQLPFSKEEILSGCEDVVSSRTDLYTTWRKTDTETILVRHIVNI